MRKVGILFIFLVQIVCSQSAHAQFFFDKVDEDGYFGFEKPVGFYTNPRFNRVEGLFANVGVKFRPESVSGLQFYGDLGLGFWNDSGKRFRYTAGVRKDFFDFKRLTVGAEYFRKLASNDNWLISDVENSLASLFLRNDHKDHFGKQGLRLYVDHKFLEIHTLRFEVARQTYDALERNIDWSLFKGDFSENPKRLDSFVAEGDETNLRFIAALDWRDNPIFPLTGWYLEGIYEHTVGDFDTDGIFLTIKRFQQTFSNHRLFIRGMVGARRGDIGVKSSLQASPDTLFKQYSIDLGGIGSLRGFEDKEFTGNRMVMMNVNYLFGGDILQKIPLQGIPFFGAIWTALSLGVFVDTGWAWTTDDLDDSLFSGFGDLDLQTNVGISLLALEGVLRLDIAKRTDRSHDDIRLTFRLLKTF